MTDADRLFNALADPTRRSVFEDLVHRGEATATELAADRPVSRQAVAKHLQVLADAGLVASTKVGREQRYRATPRPLDDAVAWMVSAGAAWDARLDRLQRRVAGASGRSHTAPR